jgi:hypothetical protein
MGEIYSINGEISTEFFLIGSPSKLLIPILLVHCPTVAPIFFIRIARRIFEGRGETVKHVLGPLEVY